MKNYSDNFDVDVDDILNQIPKDISNMQLPDPTLRNLYMYEQNRVIWLEDDIDDFALSTVKKIMLYNKQDKGLPIDERKPIKIFLDTPGGDINIMLVIINAIKMSRTPVYTINFCRALSAGAHILAAGHKRFAMPGSTVLIHSGSCSFAGTAEQADSVKKYYDAQSKLINEQILNDTKIDPKVFKKKSPSDWYISDKEALEFGIVDKIIDCLDEII